MDREADEQSDNTATIATMATSERDPSLAAKIDESSGENGQGFCSTTAAQQLVTRAAHAVRPETKKLVKTEAELRDIIKVERLVR
jgi:hypothetical protein